MTQDCFSCQYHRPSSVPEHVTCQFPVPIWIQMDGARSPMLKADAGATCLTWKAQEVRG